MDSDRLLDLIGLLVLLGILFGGGTLLFLSGPGPADPTPSPPEANWTATRVNATHVQLAHTGGDPVGSDSLLVTVGGQERTATWSGEVSRGDVGVVRAAEGQPVELLWAAGGSERVSLGTWRP